MNDQRPSILAIDDTPANLITLGTALEAEFKLQIATSGAKGLALASKSLPDLILLDVMMPEMDGYETCRRLKADPKLKNIPVIFVTALTDISAETAGLGLGAADYITKPLNVEIARQRIKNLVEREQLRKEVEAHRDHLEGLLNEIKESSTLLANKNAELETALSRVKQLEGIITICMRCKKIRDGNNDWQRLEKYIGEHSDARFSHGLCPDCYKEEMSKLD